LFSIYFRSFVVKELTPEELEKTERFAKACSDILKSEKSEEEKLSFGVALDKRNASVSASLYRTKKISDRQLEFERSKRLSDQRQQLEFERSKRSRFSDSEVRSLVHVIRHKRRVAKLKLRRFQSRISRDIIESDAEEGNFTNTDDVTNITTSGVDFTNVLHNVFISGDPKITKKTVALLGSSGIKPARKMLVKLTTDDEDEDSDPEQMGHYVPPKTTPKPRVIKPILMRNVTKR
jgi:hypothetical protein